MRIVDLPVVEFADRAVAAIHDLGVERKVLYRGLALVIMAEAMWRNAHTNLLGGFILALMMVGVCILDESRRRRLGTNGYNAEQLAARLSIIFFALRAGIVVSDTYNAVTDFLGADYTRAASEVAWTVWWYVSMTYEPPNPPKHSWREWLAPTKAGAGAR